MLFSARSRPARRARSQWEREQNRAHLEDADRIASNSRDFITRDGNSQYLNGLRARKRDENEIEADDDTGIENPVPPTSLAIVTPTQTVSTTQLASTSQPTSKLQTIEISPTLSSRISPPPPTLTPPTPPIPITPTVRPPTPTSAISRTTLTTSLGSVTTSVISSIALAKTSTLSPISLINSTKSLTSYTSNISPSTTFSTSIQPSLIILTPTTDVASLETGVSSSNSSLPSTAIVGIAAASFGCVGLIIILAVFMWKLCRHRKSHVDEQPLSTSTIPPPLPPKRRNSAAGESHIRIPILNFIRTPRGSWAGRFAVANPTVASQLRVSTTSQQTNFMVQTKTAGTLAEVEKTSIHADPKHLRKSLPLRDYIPSEYEVRATDASWRDSNLPTVMVQKDDVEVEIEGNRISSRGQDLYLKVAGDNDNSGLWTPATTMTTRDSRVESVASLPRLRATDAWSMNWVERGRTRGK